MTEYKILITDAVINELNERNLDFDVDLIERIAENVYNNVEDMLSMFLDSTQFDGVIADNI